MMDTLVTTGWLASHLDDPDLVVLDCSVRTVQNADGMQNFSGFDDYQKGHIPGAGFADLKGDLSDLSADIEFAVPSPQHFCETMGKLGVGDNSKVVLYDDSMTAWAARVWWMLRWVGFDNAALLDGGLAAWKAQERPLSTQPAPYAPQQLSLHLRPKLIADRDEVFAAISDDSVGIVDTLLAPMYNGEVPAYGRPGHIPSAVNICGIDLQDESGHYRETAELEALHDGSDKNKRAITYCGGGILASSSAFIMTRLGYKDVSVYTASLQEWAADPANPMSVEKD